jgi:hypothetical protein
MTMPPEPAPAPAPKPSKLKVFSKAQNDIGGISLPKFTSDTGAVVGLIALSMVWSLIRTFATADSTQSGLGAAAPVHAQLVRVMAGTWVVGLGILIVHEFDPHVAMLFALLVLVGNVLTNNAGNKAVINALGVVLGTGAPTGSPNPVQGGSIVPGSETSGSPYSSAEDTYGQ